MPVFSLIVLAFYIFLQSAVNLTWFAVAPKLLGIVGIVFVVAVVVDAVFWHRDHPTWFKRTPAA